MRYRLVQVLQVVEENASQFQHFPHQYVQVHTVVQV
jgi:hypothetical protein